MNMFRELVQLRSHDFALEGASAKSTRSFALVIMRVTAGATLTVGGKSKR